MHITCSIKGSTEVENSSEVVNYGHNIPVGPLLQTDEEERKTGCEYDAEAHNNNDGIAMEKIDKFTPTKCLSKIPNQRKEQEILEECENVSLRAFNYDTTIDDKESVAENDASELHIEKAKYELDASLTEESLIQEGENPRNEVEEVKRIAGAEFDTTNLHMNKTECEFEAYTTNQLVASAGSVVENTLSVAERRMTPVNMMFGSTSRLEDIGEMEILTIQQPRAEELQVNEVLGAAGGIYNAHIGELQMGLYQQIPEPWVIVVDDRGQLIGTTVMLYLFQVLILNLLVRYRIIIAGMLSFMFDPGGNCRSIHLSSCGVLEYFLDNSYVDDTRDFKVCLKYRDFRTQKEHDLKELNVPACAFVVDMLLAVAHNGSILAWKSNFGSDCTELVVALKCYRKRLLFGSEDRKICVWDLENHQCVKTVCGCTYFVVSFSCCGYYSPSGSQSIIRQPMVPLIFYLALDIGIDSSIRDSFHDKGQYQIVYHSLGRLHEEHAYVNACAFLSFDPGGIAYPLGT